MKAISWNTTKLHGQAFHLRWYPGGGEAWSFILTLSIGTNEVTIGAFNWLFSVIRSAKSNSRNRNRQTEISHFHRPWRRSVKRFMQWHTIFLLVKYFLVTSNSQWNWRKPLQSFGVFLHLLQHSNIQTPQKARHSCFHLSQLLNSLGGLNLWRILFV